MDWGIGMYIFAIATIATLVYVWIWAMQKDD